MEMTNVADMKCAKCRVTLKGSSDSSPNALNACPICGTADTFANVLREIGEYLQEHAAKDVEDSFRELVRGNKSFGIAVPKKQRAWRFIVDAGLGDG
jgi:hypothetical protein